MSKHYIQNAALRSVAIFGYRAYARAQFWRRGERIFLNSLPKSGTHLLMGIFDQSPNIMNARLHVRNADVGITDSGNRDRFDPHHFRRLLKNIRGGQVVTAHMPYTPEAEAVLVELGYRTIMLVRDPRDLLVSRLHYILGLKRHPLHSWLTAGFRDDNERLLALIHGGGAAHPEIPAYGQSIANFVGWQTARNTLTLRFEDIIGRKGGGDEARRIASIAVLFRHVGLSDADLATFLASVDETRPSATLRKGIIGDWRNTFVTDVMTAYDEAVAPHAIALGYAEGAVPTGQAS